MKTFRAVSSTLIIALAASACAADPDVDAEAGDPAAESQEELPGMNGMDMSGMQSTGMMAEMMSHMQMMQGMTADSMMVVMPAHRQMAANLLAQMNQEMRTMNMPSDAQWDATVDSVRQDLTRMPEMSAVEMEAFMPAHHRRMMRLMEMHRSMTGGREP